MLFCIVLYGKQRENVILSIFHHKNKIVVIFEIGLISESKQSLIYTPDRDLICSKFEKSHLVIAQNIVIILCNINKK